jgi:hypothetical protein
MSSIGEVEKAVLELSGEEFAEFRRWFYELDAKAWDAQFEEDVRSGRLEKLGEKALADFRSGRTRPL